MNIVKIDNPNLIELVLNTLKKGGVIIFPTETAYGVGVDATNSKAVTKLLTYKKRPEGKAISIAVADVETAERFVEINSSAKNFYNSFMPGPVTIISRAKHVTDLRLESEKGTLGIRIPNYKLLLDILKQGQVAITATSANISGGKTPYSISDILDNIPEKNKELIDLIIDAGELPKNPPSTVIDTTTNELTILRSGRINPLKSQLLQTRTTNSESETIQYGYDFIKENYSKEHPTLILLSGELGAGKTHFTKGIAKYLGITQVVKSPTFNYVNEYYFNDNTIFHMDAWRIESKNDLNALRFYEWFKPGNVIVIEWPSVIINLDEDFFNKLNYFYAEFTNKDYNQREIKLFNVKN